MTFRKDYQALEGQFKERVKADNELFGWRGKNRSRYLPNVVPKGKVDFVLVAMEPSSNAWDKDGNLLTPRDFHFSGEDFVLHYCLRYYLCADGQTYHVTDLAKGAMPSWQLKTLKSAGCCGIRCWMRSWNWWRSRMPP